MYIISVHIHLHAHIVLQYCYLSLPNIRMNSHTIPTKNYNLHRVKFILTYTHTHTHKHAHTHTLTSLRSSKYTEIPILKYLAIIFYNIYNLISFCLIYLISDFIRTCYFVHNEFTFTWISVSPFYLYYLQYFSALSLPWNTLSYEFYDTPLQSWTTICKLLAGIILVLMKCETSFLKQ